MPPPPYHTVIDPNSPIPTIHTFDAEDSEREEEEEEEEDDTPQVDINASTQIKGHGNIISIAQMDTVRIANLIAGLLHGNMIAPTSLPQQQPPSTSTPEQSRGQAQAPAPQPTMPPKPRNNNRFPRIKINLNCGATIVGDRNIVGPGLGDIARHMQIAQQRNQAMLAQKQAQAQMDANRTATGVDVPVPGFPVLGQQPMVTPPMSRCSSFGSEEGQSGGKRKAEECEGRAGKRCC
jgi:hypothetical protein